MNNKVVKWGIIGLGSIAERFAKSIANSSQAVLYAAASRTEHKREYFKQEYKVSIVYETYEKMLADPQLDAVYIALPHGFHMEWVIKALNSKKAVLCEKPVGMNFVQTREMIETARNNGLFFGEAMKGRYIPFTKQIKRELSDGTIGRIHKITANFCGDVSHLKETNPGHYIFDPKHGGALFDVGIYPLNFVMDIVKEEVLEVSSKMNYGANAVNQSFTATLTFANDITAEIEAAIDQKKEREAYIYGEKGYIRVPVYNRPEEYFVVIGQERVKHVKSPLVQDDMFDEIEEASRCIRMGEIESPLFTQRQIAQVMKIMDLIEQSEKGK